MKILLTRLLVGFLWTLHWLPLPVLRAIGWLMGQILYVLGQRRRQVALTNLRLCFPDMTEAERKRLARRHFVAFSRAFIDRTLGWWAPPWRLRRLIRLKGAENLQNALDRPVIMLAPHFVGLDAGGTMLTLAFGIPMISMYSNQKNPVINQVLLDGRRRFAEPVLLSRQDGMRKVIKALKDGYPFYYLPDMDFGPKESIFAPFFGVPAATVPGVSRLARLTNARVVPCITRQLPDGYELEILPAWDDYPGESVEADTERMNSFIESQVLRMPEQYHWLHRRFKTRPPGEERVYP